MGIFDFFKKGKRDINSKEEMPAIKRGLGNYLVEKGIITSEQQKEALDYQEGNKQKRIGEILTEIDILGEDEVLEQLANYLNVNYVQLEELTFPLNLQGMFSKKTMIEKNFAPFELTGNIISIAISDINNTKLRDEIENTVTESMANYHVAYYLSLPGMVKDFINNSFEKHPHDRQNLLSKKKKFGEYLIEKKIISQEQMDQVLEAQKEYVHKRFGELLYEMKIINKETALKELASHEGKDYESLENIEPEKNLINLFELDFMAENNFVPFGKEGKTVKIAMNNIFDDDLMETIADELKKKNMKVKFYMSMRDSIRHFLEKSKKD